MTYLTALMLDWTSRVLKEELIPSIPSLDNSDYSEQPNSLFEQPEQNQQSTTTTTTLGSGNGGSGGMDGDISGGGDGGDQRGRTVLTVLYLCVLALCFVVPVFYYFRMHCEERHARRMRDLEIAGITQALEQSENVHREESRAARRKYREERRARILQLFAPVRMILKLENFPHMMNGSSKTNANVNSNSNSTLPKIPKTIQENEEKEDQEDPHPDVTMDITMDSMESQMEALPEDFNHGETEDESDDDMDDQEEGTNHLALVHTGAPNNNNNSSSSSINSINKPSSMTKIMIKNLDLSEKSLDLDNTFIEVPAPGLPKYATNFPSCSPVLSSTSTSTSTSSMQDTKQKMRLVPNCCSICLMNYEIGSDITWSSNELCEHVFHSSCIEQWLMKQRDGPLCPCCRRDFIIDPYDLEDEETEDVATETRYNGNDGGNDTDDDEEPVLVLSTMEEGRMTGGEINRSNRRLDQAVTREDGDSSAVSFSSRPSPSTSSAVSSSQSSFEVETRAAAAAPVVVAEEEEENEVEER